MRVFVDNAICLRPHHVICVLFYKGLGYSPLFIANMSAIVGDIRRGTLIECKDGPDDICAPLECCSDKYHCTDEDVIEMDATAKSFIEFILHRDIEVDRLLGIEEFRKLYAAVSEIGFPSCCQKCTWYETCGSTLKANNSVLAPILASRDERQW